MEADTIHQAEMKEKNQNITLEGENYSKTN